MKFFNSKVRHRISLEGVWRLVAREEVTVSEAEKPPEDWSEALDVALPGWWNNQLPDLFYRTIAWARRDVYVPATWPEEVWLFCGIHAWGLSAWVNGEHVGDHEGYLCTYFKVKVKPGVVNSIVLRMDNSASAERIGTRFDSENFGGVFGKILLEARRRTYVEDVKVETSQGRHKAVVHVKTKLSSREGELTLKVLDGDRELGSRRVEAAVEGLVEDDLTIEEPILWSPENPKLYRLEATVTMGEKILDQVDICFGVRSIEVTPEGICINGKPTFLRGVLAFHDHPDTGRYLPTYLILKDFYIAKKANVNAWRLHYPVDQEFLDLADRHGFLIVECIPLTWPDDITSRQIMEQTKQQISEMISRDENHPCIIAWGIWNELFQSETAACREATKELIDHTKSLDQSRISLIATDKPLEDSSLDLPNMPVLGINLYPFVHIMKEIKGTGPPMARVNYLRGGQEAAATEAEKAVEILTAVKNKVPRKPVILTEWGGATYVSRLFHAPMDSEDYRALHLRKFVPAVLKEGVCGLFYSCYTDWITKWPGNRTLEVGWWGIVDGYRKPKLIYNVLRELYEEIKDRY